jgi:hypothetical protein
LEQLTLQLLVQAVQEELVMEFREQTVLCLHLLLYFMQLAVVAVVRIVALRLLVVRLAVAAQAQ